MVWIYDLKFNDMRLSRIMIGLKDAKPNKKFENLTRVFGWSLSKNTAKVMGPP